jgi:hypothetical protein
MATARPLVNADGSKRELPAGDELSIPLIIHSATGGFRFPDNSVQTTAITHVAGASNVAYMNMPQNLQSTAYTLVLADNGKHVYKTTTTARTITIPANASVAFPVGTAIVFVNGNLSGVMTIAITTDVMRLAGPGTTGSRTLAANGVATALKVATTEWQISGTGLT